MDSINQTKTYDTIQVRFDEDICYLKIYRPEANNTINDRLVEECTQALKECEESAKIVVLEGLPEVFCFGADFQRIQDDFVNEDKIHKFYIICGCNSRSAPILQLRTCKERPMPAGSVLSQHATWSSVRGKRCLVCLNCFSA